MTRTTTRIISVSLQVADQDRALAFYVDVLGCQLRADVEVWPGARPVGGGQANQALTTR
jgi:catechol 2,3-dioxygenase-like lactoylglutathione lyase family enzyme